MTGPWDKAMWVFAGISVLASILTVIFILMA